MQLPFKRNITLSLLLLVFTAVFSVQSVKILLFLFTYPVHGGHEKGVFGWPIPFAHTLLCALFWIAGTIGGLLFLFQKKLGWILTQIVTIMGLLSLLLIIFLSAFFSLGNLHLKTILLFIFGCLLLLKINDGAALQLVRIDQKIKWYGIVGLSVLVLSIAAFLVLQIVPLN